MEIELTGLKRIFHQRIWIAVFLLIPVLLGLGWLGAGYTAANKDGYPVALSWSEWQVVQARQVYAAEQEALRREIESLADMLNQEPDPVRAQITAERIVRAYSKGQGALVYQRELLINAAGAVQDWSVGALPLDQAQAAMQLAINALGTGVEQP